MSVFTIRARLEIAQQACDLEAAAGAVAGGGARGTVKLMLIQSSYTEDALHDLVDNGGANDPIDHEVGVSGYTGGYGGAGRKAVSGSLTPTWARDNGNLRIEFDFTDPAAWSSLAAGETIGGVGIIVEDFLGTAGNDTESLFVAHDDTNNVATNGGDVSYSVNAEGAIQI